MLVRIPVSEVRTHQRCKLPERQRQCPQVGPELQRVTRWEAGRRGECVPDGGWCCIQVNAPPRVRHLVAFPLLSSQWLSVSSLVSSSQKEGGWQTGGPPPGALGMHFA